MNDLALRQNIIDKLGFEPIGDAADIGVAVEEGVVTLSGHVGSYAETIAAGMAVKGGIRGWRERTAAERTAWSTPGVASVTNKLSVGG